MNEGYILIWRKIEDSGLLQSPKTLALFLHLLIKATHKDIKVGTPGGIVELKRGEYISGRKELAQVLKQSEQEIRSGLERLQKLEILTIRATNRYSIYTIEKYNEYQTFNQRATNSQPTSNQQITTKQYIKANISNIYINQIPKELRDEWELIRKKKKSGAVTDRVWNAMLREASKAKLSPVQAVELCCEKNWAGFEAAWIDKPAEVKQPYQYRNVL